MSRQVEMISLEELVPADHPYRYFKQILNESFIARCLSGVSSNLGRERVTESSVCFMGCYYSLWKI